MRIWAFPAFYPYDIPGERGRGIFAHRQYKGLIENGAELKVIIPVDWKPVKPFNKLHPRWKNTGIDFPEKRVHDGVEIYHPRIDNLLPHRLDKRTYVEKFHDAVAALFKKLNVKLDPATDIFYSQWLPEAAKVQYTAHRMGVKSAILAIGDDVVIWPHESPQKFEEFKKIIEQADIRVNVADYLGAETNRILGKDYPYTVVVMGVDYTRFKPATMEEKTAARRKFNLPEDKLLIVNIGSAIVRKGWLDLFDAAAMLTQKGMTDFGIAAAHSGAFEFDLDEEAAKRGLADRFYNLGEVSPADINSIYGVADMICLPSHWEGMANVNIEGMSSGLPVITTDVCGHPELITDGVNGILIPPKRPEIIAEKLALLLNDKELRDKLGANARTFIVEKWGNFNDNSKKLYERLLQG